jgi:RNA polymerase sigma-70 factor, ECF subfamily
VRAGDTHKFRILTERHSGILYQIACHRTSDPWLAEEMVQEALTISFTHLDQLHHPQKYKAWVQSILSNCCRMWRRSNLLKHATIDIDPAIIESLVDSRGCLPEKELLREEMRTVITALCQSLPTSLRLTSYLFYIHEMSCRHISEHLGVPEVTVATRLYKARTYIRQAVLGRTNSRSTRASALSLLRIAKEVYNMDDLRIEIAPQLIPLIQTDKPNGNVLRLLKELRIELLSTHSIQVPKIHLIDNLRLPDNGFVVFLHEQKVASGRMEDTAKPEELTTKVRQIILEHRQHLSEIA